MTAAIPLGSPTARQNVRRAFVLSSLSRYVATFLSLIATFIIARILTPTDFGLYVLGGAIFLIAEAVRDLGSVPYIVQQKDLTREKVRTVFTLSFLASLAMAILIFALAEPLAKFFSAPMLKTYIQIFVFSYALGPFVHPIYGLMSRDLAFGRIAIVETVTMLVNAVASVLLVRAGWNILGIAWASVISVGCSMLLCAAIRPEFWVYRPSLRHWRNMLEFGVNGSAASLIARSGEAASYLLLGTLLGPHATGILQRATLIAFWPERIVLSGLGAVALPAFSILWREGRPLGPSYLRAISIASAVNWAALASVALLAKPLVAVLLGPAWGEVVPLVQIFALAAVFSFPISLNAAVQTAAGGISRAPFVAFVQYALAVTVVIVGARFGTFGVAWCALAATPFMALIGTVFVRYRVPFAWTELVGALLPSVVVAGCSALAVWLVVSLGRIESPIVLCIVGMMASGIGLLAGLAMVPHPLREELSRVAKAAMRRLRPSATAT